MKTRDAVKSCLGGVMFIDEAYALGNPEKRDSFAKECIDTLCEALSDHKEELMVIIAGYEKELQKCFFAFNQGLDSRFTWRFKTDDYSPDELRQIFIKKVKDLGWRIEVNNIKTEWFETLSAVCTPTIPDCWPASYRSVVSKRIQLIQTSKEVALIEQTNYKRRWEQESWYSRLQNALRTWLLDRLETDRYWPRDAGTPPRLRTCAQLALSWVLRRKEVTSAIVGARRPEQIQETAIAAERMLTPEEAERIQALLQARAERLGR